MPKREELNYKYREAIPGHLAPYSATHVFYFIFFLRALHIFYAGTLGLHDTVGINKSNDGYIRI